MLRHLDKLDRLDGRTKYILRESLKKSFRYHSLICIILDIILIGCTLFEIIFYWKDCDGFIWIILRFPTLIRTAILILITVSYWREIDYIRMIGVGKYYNIVRYFKTGNRILGLWLIIGFVDLYIIRYPITIIDVIRLFIYIFSHPGNDDNINNNMILSCKIVYLVMDIIFIMEFYWTLCLLYYRAIWISNKLDI
jgi:hypothetical protein